MSFDNKNYPNRKDHRKQYIGAQACDTSCRPNGGCPVCRDNRLHRTKREMEKAKSLVEDVTHEKN